MTDPFESLRQARAAFEESLLRSQSAIAALQQETDRALHDHQEDKQSTSIDARFEGAARSGDCGEQMRLLQARVDNGEFTWDDAFTGQVADPDVMRVTAEVAGSLKAACDEVEDQEQAPENLADATKEFDFDNQIGWLR